MDKLKTYKIFETHITEPPLIYDENIEKDIDEVVNKIIAKKQMISMLSDTIEHVSEQLKKCMPLQIDEFMQDLFYYDDEIYDSIDKIKEKMIDGYPNVNDLIEEVKEEIIKIENYMKLKKT